MATVWVPAEFKELADRLAKNVTKDGGRPIFQTYMELMIFAAMIGYELEDSEELDAKDRGSEIADEVFVRSGRDGLVFLIALQKEKSAEILREKRDAECWRVIESYAVCGLRKIQEWLLDSATDIDGVSSLLTKMKEQAAQMREYPEPTKIGPVEF